MTLPHPAYCTLLPVRVLVRTAVLEHDERRLQSSTRYPDILYSVIPCALHSLSRVVEGIQVYVWHYLKFTCDGPEGYAYASHRQTLPHRIQYLHTSHEICFVV